MIEDNQNTETEEVLAEISKESPYVEIVTILNKAFEHFNELYCEGFLKRPLITILSRGRRAVLGWHWKDKWDYQGSLHTEIMIAAETLDRPIQDVLETLLHEMVHLHNSQNNIPDCNAAQYHNKNFKKIAESVFHLEVEKMPQRGYALTKLSDKAGDDVRNFIAQEAISNFRLKRIEEPKGASHKKQYMLNVSEEDFYWFKEVKEQLGLKSKEFFALLRDSYQDQNYETLEETGT